MPDVPALAPHPDRLLPAEPGLRAIARRLYDEVRGLPVIFPHGHVDAWLLYEDSPFPDPATLLVSTDHYVTRLLHADGVPLDRLGVGQGPHDAHASRSVWRELCDRWHLFRGTPSRYWLESELADIFGVRVRPSAATADAIYDQVAVPTFRPDRYLEPTTPGWPQSVTALGEAAGVDVGDFAGYLRALEACRRHFIEHGATSADHSHRDVVATPLDAAETGRIYKAALSGQADPEDATVFRRHMLFEMARMSTEDGLVMTLYPGVCRSHHAPTFERYGRDTGHDIPVQVEFTEALRPLLERLGTHPDFHLVLFTLDETTFSRKIAPLAGFYRSVYAGAPWWFLDAPDAIARFRSAVNETAGLSRTTGFIDDTRAFCSVPARHDMSRRLDSAFLARLVAEHRLDMDEVVETAVRLVADNPRAAFKL